MDNFIMKYVRDRHNHIVGAVVATGPGKVGFSLCHRKDMNFGRYADKTQAIDLALSRAENNTSTVENCPHSAKKTFIEMIERSKRYFK